MDIITRSDGLTDAEGVVAWVDLPRQHPDDIRDFTDGVHKCQDQLAVRVARRAFPIGWPDKGSGRGDVKPRRTHTSTNVYRLVGGTDVYRLVGPCIGSTIDPSQLEPPS